MIEYLAAVWLTSCAHLHWDDPANPSPEHPVKYSRELCVPLPPYGGLRSPVQRLMLDDNLKGVVVKIGEFCVENTSDEVRYVTFVHFPEKEQIEMGPDVKPCEVPVS